MDGQSRAQCPMPPHLLHLSLPLGPPRAGTAVAEPAAAAAAAEAPSTAVIFAVLADEDVASLEVGVVEHLDGVGGGVDGVHLDDAASLGTAAGTLGEDLGVDHVASLAEVVLEILPRDAPRKVMHVQAVGGDLDHLLVVIVASVAAAAAVGGVAVAAAGAAGGTAHPVVVAHVGWGGCARRWGDKGEGRVRTSPSGSSRRIRSGKFGSRREGVERSNRRCA